MPVHSKNLREAARAIPPSLAMIKDLPTLLLFLLSAGHIPLPPSPPHGGLSKARRSLKNPGRLLLPQARALLLRAGLVEEALFLQLW